MSRLFPIRWPKYWNFSFSISPSNEYSGLISFRIDWPSCLPVQFSRSVVSDSFWPHGLQHIRLPCLSPTPRVYPNSCPLSQCGYSTISSSVAPFSACPQSFPASGYFQMSQLFAWGGQSIGVSASASVLPMNIQDWFPLGWTGWISLQSKGLSRVFSNTTVQKHQFFSTQLHLQSNSPYMTTVKTIALTRRTFVGKVMSLLLNMLSKGLSRVLSCTTVWKHQFFGAQPSLWSNSHIHTWLLEKP